MLAMLTVAAMLALPQDAKESPKIVPATPIAPAKKDETRSADKSKEVKSLGVGDPAPAFQYDEWIKGEKVDGLAKGKVHVVEFWATWCGPCIAVMPHLSELQKKHPEVVVLSVAASERGESESSKIEKVKKFVEGKGDTMSYRIVYAGDREKMSKPWMQAAGQNGIPCAFIVDKTGSVAWIGHPASMDTPLEQIVAGTYDLAAEKARAANERAAGEMRRGIAMALRDARQSGDYTAAIDAMRKALAAAPNDALRMQLMQTLVGPAKQPAEGWKVAEEILESGKGNAMMMNQLAWTIVDPKAGVEEPNLAIAQKAAERACELTKNGEGSMLDTLARVHFLKGDIARAIELQKAAIEKAPAGAMKDEMQATLAEYESKIKKA